MPSQTIKYSTAENLVILKSVVSTNKDKNLRMNRHLERTDNGGVIIVEDGIVDVDKEIQSELKNAGLQNILRLQELKFGSVDAAIARNADKGVYADVSNIPTNVADQAEFIKKANSAISKLKADLGLTDAEIDGLTAEKLVKIYESKAQAAASASQDNTGGAE